MRLLRLVVLILMQAVLLGAGLYYFFGNHPTFINTFSFWMLPPVTEGAFDWRPSPLGKNLFWVGVLLLPPLYWLLTIRLYQRNHGTLTVKTHSGDAIQFQLGAIEEFVHTQVKAHPGVLSHSVRVWQNRAGATLVNLAIKVKPIDSVPEIHRQVKELLRDGLVNVLGIENVGAINVEIKRVLGGPRRTSGPQVTPEPAPEAPIRARLDEPTATDPIPHAEATQRIEFRDEADEHAATPADGASTSDYAPEKKESGSL